MIFQGKEFREYDSHYFVSADGDIYSTYKKGLLKHNIDLDGYHRVDIHGRHMKVHKLVFLVWVDQIPLGSQLNHKDDNKDHNHYSNLYLGTQKENIRDCIQNGTRKGHLKSIKVLDKRSNEVLSFSSVRAFIEHTGHKVANGALSKCKQHKWFQEQYEIISIEGVETIKSSS